MLCECREGNTGCRVIPEDGYWPGLEDERRRIGGVRAEAWWKRPQEQHLGGLEVGREQMGGEYQPERAASAKVGDAGLGKVGGLLLTVNMECLHS